MDTNTDDRAPDQGEIDAAAKKEAWSAGESKGRELAQQGETKSENVKSAGRDAGRSAAEQAGADADVGETPGEHGALAGWCDENPDLARAEVKQDTEAMQRRIWAGGEDDQ